MLVCVGVLSFTLTAAAEQFSPPSRPAVGPSPAPQPPQPQTVIVGRGPVEAERVLLVSSQVLPFTPRLPAIPSEYELAQVEARVTRPGSALIDLLYTAPGNAQIQVFESSYANSKKVVAPVLERDSLEIANTTWQYLLLNFRQPDGSSILVHFAERAFDGHTYASVGLRSRGDLPREKAMLVGLLDSMR